MNKLTVTQKCFSEEGIVSKLFCRYKTIITGGFGSKDQNGSWNGIVGMVHRGV